MNEFSENFNFSNHASRIAELVNPVLYYVLDQDPETLTTLMDEPFIGEFS